MELVLAGLQTVDEPLRRGTPLPLSQLVEESRSRVPNHLLESKIYANVKTNSVITAEPAELHFSGFELETDYLKTLKLINISSDVMNIHIIPTQTKHFQTTYTKKYRLIPGLAYTVTVAFCPDEWRYFYDCIRVHCQGEENLLIPVHAYPVINDLHIPPHINLSAVPLGQSAHHTIPLRCSCPVEFEFQVFVLQPHEAFSVHPLAGVIPASGEARVTVTFHPVQYGTFQVTIQLVVSQFNTRPQLCSITGRCTPHLSQSERRSEQSDVAPAESVRPPRAARLAPPSKTTHRPSRKGDTLAVAKLSVDICTPAGVAKMLIKDSTKLNSKKIREAIASSSSMVALQGRQLKEALFKKSVQENVKEEQANHLSWQVHLGSEPLSEWYQIQTLEQREDALHEYMIKSGAFMHQKNFVAGRPKLSCTRLIRAVGQAPEGTPSFQFYTTFHWELRYRPLTMFQQAARKVVVQCRANRRLASLRKLADRMKAQASNRKVMEKETTLDIHPLKVFPSTFPIFCHEDDPLAGVDSVAVPVDLVDATLTTHTPYFKLQVPQHYKLMGYHPVSTWGAFTSYIPSTLARPLRSVAPDEVRAEPQGGAEPKAEEHEAACLSFTAPEALLTPFPANPLRIFNPAPGLQTYKPAPKYLESDLEFHLCPLPRFTVPGSNVCSMRTQTPQAHRKFQHHKDLFPEVMKWKNFTSVTLNYLSSQQAVISDPPLTGTCTDYSTDTLPLAAPPPIATLTHYVTLPMDSKSEGSGLQLTPEMIRATFLSGEVQVSNGNEATEATDSVEDSPPSQAPGGADQRAPTRPDGKKKDR